MRKANNREILQLVITELVHKYATANVRDLVDPRILTARNLRLILEHPEHLDMCVRSYVREAIELTINSTVRAYGKNVLGNLVRVFNGKKIEIPATDGRRTFTDAFPTKASASSFDKNRRRSKPTPKTEVQIYDVFAEAKPYDEFAQICHLFEKQSKDLCLTEAQIAMFCRNRRRFLKKDDYTIFFYEERDGSVGLAQVDFDDDSCHREERGWFIGPIEFDGELCGRGERIVIPVFES